MSVVLIGTRAKAPRYFDNKHNYTPTNQLRWLRQNSALFRLHAVLKARCNTILLNPHATFRHIFL